MNLDDYSLTLSNILTRIDEYGLYCHYLNFEPDIRTTFSSPIREGDYSPSFSFYNAKPGSEVEFLWKDSAINKSGTIAQLLMYMYSITFEEALRKIDSDFKLGFTDGNFNINTEKKLLFKKPKKKDETTISVNSIPFSEEGLKYWESFNISEKLLKEYNVTELFSSTINNKVFYYKTITFAYRIGDRYKIYSPMNVKYKFINNYKSTFAEGFIQLKKDSDKLIITKSLKDVMVLRSLNYEAISPRSENTVLPKEYFKWVNTHYKKIRVLFDNDMKHNGDRYPYNKVYIPKDSNCKDISDFIREYGKKETENLLINILKF